MQRSGSRWQHFFSPFRIYVQRQNGEEEPISGITELQEAGAGIPARKLLLPIGQGAGALYTTQLWPPRWVNYRSRGQREVRRDGGLLLSERRTHRAALELSKNGIFRREQFCVFSVAAVEVMCPCSGIQGDAEGWGTLVLWCKR